MHITKQQVSRWERGDVQPRSAVRSLCLPIAAKWCADNLPERGKDKFIMECMA